MEPEIAPMGCSQIAVKISFVAMLPVEPGESNSIPESAATISQGKSENKAIEETAEARGPR
jgi:hypothetical protein